MISMNRGPLIEIKSVVEYIAINKTDHIDPFFKNCWQILQKDERGGVVILVKDAVIDN